MYKISQLTELSNGNVADADYFEIIDDSDSGTTGSGKNKRVTVSSLSTKFSSNSSAFTGSNQSKAASGFQKLPGGVILQWGKDQGTTPSEAWITFPTPFPTAITSISFTAIQDGGSTSTPSTICLRSVPTVTQFQIEKSAQALSSSFHWMAIGY